MLIRGITGDFSPGLYASYSRKYNIIEQEIDGETMVTCASMEQLQACGLKTVKLQMRFRKLTSSAVDSTNSGSTVSGTVSSTPTRGRKLTQEGIKALTPEQKRLYLMR